MDKGKVLNDIMKKEASLSRVIYDNVTVSLSQDYIIPESVDDTSEVLLTSRRVTLNKVEAENGSVEICGDVFYDVLLLCEDGTLSGVSYTDSFETSFYCGDVGNGCTVITGSCTSDGASRLINPRKLGISSVLTIPLTVIATSSASSEIIGAESIDDEMTVQRRSETVECVSATSKEDADIPVSIDVELEGNNPPISKILYRRLDLSPTELKARGNQLEARLNAQLCIIYLSEEGNCFTFSKSIPLERTLEIPDAEDYIWSICVCYSDLTVEPAQNSYGEMKLLELDMTYSVKACGIKNHTSSVYTDFYSTEYDCESTKVSDRVTFLKRSYSSALSVNASATYEELKVKDVRGVVAAVVTVKEPSVSFVKDRKKLVFEATAVIDCACENVYITDADTKYSSCTYTYPVKCELDASDEGDASEYVSDTSVYGVRCRADGSRLYCDIELGIRVSSFVSSNIDHVSEARLDKSATVTRPTSAITLCYPGGSETLWDIAKYYKVTEEAILSANSLEDNDISGKKVLLIPSRKLQKAAF